ncbi:VPA1269 family protein [Vibrio cyclitrophicus]
MVKKKYSTFLEAKVAVQRLKIKTQGEYKKRYKEDPCLPSVPYHVYREHWIDWYDFTGRERPVDLYPTIGEAKAAIKTLGIVSSTEYKKRHKEDPHLPSNPQRCYKNEWVDMYDYLSKEPPVDLYPTLAEAKAAVQHLKIKTHGEYRKRYKEDPRLSLNADKVYQEQWLDWYDFFGKVRPIKFYSTLVGAKIAVQSLGIKSKNEYNKRYKEDSRLPSSPHLYYNHDWLSWHDFVGKDQRVELFPTYEDAKVATQRLGIKGYDEYRERYKEDPCLPSAPSVAYQDEWVNWSDYLGKKQSLGFYPTYEEARAATEVIGVKTQADYQKIYREDPRLPSSPHLTYRGKGWINWPKFFAGSILSYAQAVEYLSEKHGDLNGVEYISLPLKELGLPPNPKLIYEEYYDWDNYVGITYRDPLDAIRLLRDKGQHVCDTESYQKHQKLYRALPQNAVAFYGFNTFDEFLSFDKDKLWNAEKVREYCNEHKISSKEEYDKASSSEPYLAYKPDQIQGFTKTQYLLFRPLPFDVFSNSKFDDWIAVAEEWTDTGVSIKNRQRLIKGFYETYRQTLPAKPQSACDIDFKFPDINVWLTSLSDSFRHTGSLKILIDFFDYIIEKRCSITCEETGEITTLEGYRNPIKKQNITTDISGEVSRSESNKQALPFRFIDDARHFLIRHKKGAVENILELYKRLLEKSSVFDSKSEWFEVEGSVINTLDPDCVWKKEGDQFFMWSPVRIIAVLFQLYMPFRGQQICWLDSGEADEKLLVNEGGKWVWKDNSLFPNYRVKVNHHQGILLPRDSFSGVGCHVNTNKTAKNAYTGYDIPWIDDRLISWVIRLRDWQTKYNPLDTPTRWTSLRDIHNVYRSKSVEVLQQYGYKGRSCFLFRDPTQPKSLRHIPISQSKLASAYAAVLYNIQSDELPLATLKEKKDKNITGNSLSNFRALFTLHSMRVSLITAFIRDAKIAPEIVQKLVGHSSIVMTIYYTKVQDEEIRKALQESESLIIKNQTQRVEIMIRQRKMEKLTSELIGAKGELITSTASDIPAAANSIMDFGLCPYGRTRCHDGGERQANNTTRYEHVRAGYLGNSNSLTCRHFRTGPAFIGGLQMLCNEISLECKASANVMGQLRDELDNLEDEQYTAKRNGEIFTKTHQLSLTASHYEQEVTKFDGLTLDLIVAIRLFMNSVELLNRKIKGENETKGLSLITLDDESAIQAQMNEVSDFIHLDMICQSASIHQSARPRNASLARSQLLDLFAKKNGLYPSMFLLSEKQQLAIGNEITQLLRARTGSWEKVEELMDKESVITLKDLGIKEAEIQENLKLLFDGRSLSDLRLSATKPELKSGGHQ